MKGKKRCKSGGGGGIQGCEGSRAGGRAEEKRGGIGVFKGGAVAEEGQRKDKGEEGRAEAGQRSQEEAG